MKVQKGKEQKENRKRRESFIFVSIILRRLQYDCYVGNYDIISPAIHFFIKKNIENMTQF